MKTKLLLIVFINFWIIQNCFSQLKDKTGLFIREYSYGKEVAYYKNGQRDGLYLFYNKVNGLLMYFGQYQNGKKVGTWYYFDEQGHLLFEESQIQENKKYYLTRYDGKKLKPKYMSYVKNYYPNGYLESEGYVVYFKAILEDYYKVGEWKYYDSTGRLIKTEYYKDVKM